MPPIRPTQVVLIFTFGLLCYAGLFYVKPEHAAPAFIREAAFFRSPSYLSAKAEPPLTLELLAASRASPQGEIILYYTNKGFIGHLMNSVCSLRAAGNEHFVIAAIDQDMLDTCETLGLPCATSATGLQEDHEAMDFSSAGYHRIVQSKTAQVEVLLRQGLHVLFSDVDTYYLQDPLQQDLPCRDGSCHLAMSTNLLTLPHPWETFPVNFNSGLYYVRSSDALLEEWTKIREAIRIAGELEQPPFNAVLCGQKTEYKDPNAEACVTPSGIRTVMLDPTKFVVSYSIVLTPSKFESIYLWSTIPRSLVSIHLAWLAGEKNKMKTWQKNGLIAFNSTTLECVPEKREKGWHKAWQGKKLEKVVSGIEAIVIASES